MAAGTTLVSVEEYFATDYVPSCEYVDGVLRKRSMGSRKHGLLQAWLCQLINVRFPDFEAETEVHVQIRTGKYLIPDLIVQRRDSIQEPYPSVPVHLCVEILSPGDDINEVLAKCEEYHAWGVEMTWAVDPEEQRAWEYRKGQRPVEILRTGSMTVEGISIPVADVFSVL